jgi:hypothetical protein
MKLLIVLVFTALISAIETVSYAARLAGARTRRVGASASLFNILVVFSRFAVMVQTVLIATMVDRAVRVGDTAGLIADFRLVLLAMSGGIVLGIVLLPSVARIIAIGTAKLDRHGSVPRIVLAEGLFRTLRKIPTQVWLPAVRRNWRELRAAEASPSFFWLNAAIFVFYAIANLSAMYASTLVEARATAIQMASVINGVGTVLLAVFVDPVSAKLLDDVVIDRRPIRDLKAAILQLGAGRLLGTLIAQLLLTPFGLAIAAGVHALQQVS